MISIKTSTKLKIHPSVNSPMNLKKWLPERIWSIWVGMSSRLRRRRRDGGKTFIDVGFYRIQKKVISLSGNPLLILIPLFIHLWILIPERFKSMFFFFCYWATDRSHHVHRVAKERVQENANKTVDIASLGKGRNLYTSSR